LQGAPGFGGGSHEAYTEAVFSAADFRVTGDIAVDAYTQ
jgi:hypothetical protein